MSGDPGVEVSGGGSISVDTPAMLEAGRVLEHLREGIAALVPRIAACSSLAAPGTAQRGALESAEAQARQVAQHAETVADALRGAAERYGLAEHAATAAEQSASAGVAAVLGRLSATPATFLPGVLLSLEVVGVALAVPLAQEWLTTGRVGTPWMDPALLHPATTALSSVDDWTRGLLGVETAHELLRNDPASLLGTETIALAAAAVLYPAPTAVSVRATATRAVRRPRDLAELAARLPDGGSPDGQVRIERYGDGRGAARWIVYSAGTVTFDRDSGVEPFDMASNLRGVGRGPAESQQAVLDAMRRAGVRRDEPVLLVGHSQGALNVVRIAERGGYAVGGVVEFGGPTGQVTLPADVPRIAFEHDQDPVPHLGGVAAGGAAGLSRVLVRRSVPGLAVDRSSLSGAVPSHDRVLYRRTAELAEASGSSAVADFEHRIAPFTTGGDGTATRYRAERVRPARALPADGAATRRSSR